MSLLLILQWWYGPGWFMQWQKVISRARSIGGAYSGKTLLKTLFSPWKRVTALPSANPTIQQRFQALVDNLVSRLVGFFVRVLTLLAALVSLTVVVALSVTLAIIWPLLPAISIAALIKGFGI